jgi:hypothetical protein
MFRAAVSQFVISILLASSVSAHVRVVVPSNQYKPDEKIYASVENDGGEPVTFCVEMGQTSTNHIIIESTPVPFIVEMEINQGWRTLLIGPDVGSSRQPVVLKPQESLKFPFWLHSHGRIRLRLLYWRGAKPELNCAKPPRGAHNAKSATFAFLEVED